MPRKIKLQMEAIEEERDDQDSKMGGLKMGRQKMETALQDATKLLDLTAENMQ